MRVKGVPDVEVERLIDGQPTDDPALEQVAPVMAWLRRQGQDVPRPEQVSRFAAEAARVATSQPARPVVRRRFMPWRLTPRLAAPLAVVLVILMFGGAAVASQGTVPGDLLYGLDVALERVGIGDGGIDERLTEAAELVDRGRAGEALSHAALAMSSEDHGDTEASDALEGLAHAIEELSSGEGSEQSAQGMVAEMLQWMIDNSGLLHDPEAEPGSFGKGVAEMARRIATERGGAADPDHPGDSQGNPGGEGQGPPQGKPPNRP